MGSAAFDILGNCSMHCSTSYIQVVVYIGRNQFPISNDTRTSLYIGLGWFE